MKARTVGNAPTTAHSPPGSANIVSLFAVRRPSAKGAHSDPLCTITFCLTSRVSSSAYEWPPISLPATSFIGLDGKKWGGEEGRELVTGIGSAVERWLEEVGERRWSLGGRGVRGSLASRGEGAAPESQAVNMAESRRVV